MMTVICKIKKLAIVNKINHVSMVSRLDVVQGGYSETQAFVFSYQVLLGVLSHPVDAVVAVD